MDPFLSLKIGSLDISNRLLMAPVKTGYGAMDGQVTEKHEAYYRRRAEGGVGAIIVEPLYIDPRGKEHPKQLGISEDAHVDGLKKLVAVLHEHGTMAIAHINHAGRAANPKAAGAPPEAPSAMTCPSTGATPDVLTPERIGELVHAYARAVSRAKDAGFDAVEIQFGLGYLISQFISQRTNHREDEYGGSEENRYRFAREILEAVHKEVGKNFPLIARISATEQVEGGLTIQDAVALANFLQEHGISALHVVSGSACDSPPWYYQHMRLPSDKNLEWAQVIKQKVGIPVIVAGRMGTPATIRRALDEEMVDAVALGRPLVADPDLPLKMKENRDDDVILCGACLQGCLLKVKSGEGLGCIINPAVGREGEKIPAATSRRKVVVIGGGPAGMQTALTASQRGHDVVLFDKNDLGGQFNLSYLPPGKEMLKGPLTSLIHNVKKSPVTLKLSHPATVDEVLNEKPDVLVLATGAAPIIPPIPGLDNPLTGEDILTEKTNVGKRVLVIGGGMVGLEAAEFLAHRQHEVTVVELLEEVARDMEPITKKLTLGGLVSQGVTIYTGTEVSRVEGKKVYVKKEGKEELLGEFDSIVVAVGTRSVNELEPQLRERGVEVKIIGDAKKPRQVYDAIRDGYDVAVTL